MRKIETRVGEMFDDVINRLIQAKENGEEAFAVFNGKTFVSTGITMDSAYLQYFGKNKKDYDLEREELLKKSEEQDLIDMETTIKKIPVWVEKGKSIIPAESHKRWMECVLYRVNDLYRGKELDTALDIIKSMNEGLSFEEAVAKTPHGNHSGSSWDMAISIAKDFGPKHEKEKSVKDELTSPMLDPEPAPMPEPEPAPMPELIFPENEKVVIDNQYPGMKL